MRGYATIYIIKNRAICKLYVGCTKQTLQRRWNNHVAEARLLRKKTDLYLDMHYYGEDNFSLTPVFTVFNPADSGYLEKFFINEFKSREPFGYNLDSGGVVGKTHSPKTNERIRVSNLGKFVSKETCAKISAARTGKATIPKGTKATPERLVLLAKIRKLPRSSESNRRKSEAVSGNKNPFFGKKHSQETRQKISVARKKYFATRHRMVTYP